jgi:hypothetical protein
MGVAHAAEGADSPNGARHAYHGEFYPSIGVDATTSRVALTDGKAWDVKGTFARFNSSLDGQNREALDLRTGGEISAKVAYRVSMLGKQTPYWVQMSLTYNSYAHDACTVFKGDPRDGGRWAVVSPFNCRTSVSKTSQLHLQYHFDIDLNRWAEASGTITARELSLEGGTFRSDLPYSVPGKTELQPRQKTRFEAVMREGDDPFYENQARTEFSYQIVLDGKPTGFWAAGVSTNYRGLAFRGDGRCAIYDRDPLLGAGRLDGTKSIVSKDYLCTAVGGFSHLPTDDGNNHYHADFTVTRSAP